VRGALNLLLRLAAGLCAYGLLASAGSAGTAVASGAAAALGAHPVSGIVICPLASPGRTTTCCEPPTVFPIPCCRPSIPCPAERVTIAARPDPSWAGGRVRITGTVLGGRAAMVVTLWQRLPGGSLQQVAQTTTGATGSYRFVRSGVETNREWFVAASTGASATVEQRVHAVVTLSVAGLHAHGHVTPSHAGERILFEQHTAAGWRVIARPRLNRSSNYVVTLLGRGEVDFRAVFPGDERNIRSSSPAFTVVA
jgi:hypothetical protein